MLTVILGFFTAVVYGFADFFGALASRKISSITVTAASGFVGFVFLSALAPFIGATFSQQAIITGIAAGVASAIGISALYASLAIGPIAIVSPMGAVIGALVPMTFGFFLGDRFGWFGFVALAMILIAVVLVGFVPGADTRLPSAKGLLFAAIAGCGIGTILIVLKFSPSDSGMASIIVMRLVSAIFLNIFLVGVWLKNRKAAKSAKEKVPTKFWWAVVAAGVFDSSANIFFTLALRSGSLSVVSVLTALYPLGTIILARIVLKERIAKVQMVGVLFALTGSAILAVA